MPVHRRGIEALHIVEGNRRVDEETKQARPHQIPERYSHKKVDGPSVRRHPGARPAEGEIAIRFKAHQDQWHHFQGAEGRPQSQHSHRSAGKVEMVEGPNDTA
jgi:hypothetical protein